MKKRTGFKVLTLCAAIALAFITAATLAACGVNGSESGKDPGAKDPNTVALSEFNIIPNSSEWESDYDVVCLDRNRSGELDLFTVELVLSNIAGNPVQSFTMSGNTYTSDKFSSDSTPSRILVKNQSVEGQDGDSITFEITEIVYNTSKGTVRIKEPENNKRKVMIDPDFQMTLDFSESSYTEPVITKSVNYGDYLSLPSDTEMNGGADYRVPGMIFAGWYTEPDGGGEKINADDKYLFPFDITLYARYDVPYKYSIIENGTEVSITGLKEEFRSTSLLIEIPGEIEGLPVTEIADRAFSSVGSGKSIMLPYSVTRIGEYAFYNCSTLSIYMPNVEEIGKSAFQNPLGEGRINFSVVDPATGAYTDSQLPSSLRVIGNYAFNGTSIDTVYKAANATKRLSATVLIPQNVEYLGKFAFAGSALEAAYFPEGSALVPRNDALPPAADEDSDDVGYDFTDYFIGESVFESATKLKTVYTSYNLDGNGNIVASDDPGLGIISDYMFYNCKSLETVDFAAGVRLIGANAFASDSSNSMTKLTVASFPKELEILGNYAFANSGLTSVNFPVDSEFRILGNWAFQNTRIESVTFYSLKEYGKAPFWGNTTIKEVHIFSDGVPDVVVPDSIYDMGDTVGTQIRYYVPIAQLSSYRREWKKAYDNAYGDSLLSEYNLQIADIILAEEYVNKSAGYAFEPVNEDGILQADGETKYAKVRYLYDYGSTSLSIPEEVNIVINGGSKFYTVTDIGGYLTKDTASTSFPDLDTITSVSLPDTVRRIDEYAFYNMSKLSSIKWTYRWEDVTFTYDAGVVDGLELESIGKYAFYATSLSSFYASPKLKSIDTEAFADSALVTVDLSKSDDGGLTIGVSAFSGNKINNLTVGANVSELKRYCFANQDTDGQAMRIEFKGNPPKVETTFDPFSNDIVNEVFVPADKLEEYNHPDKFISSTLIGKFKAV